jgi:hypothetical protein
MGRRKVPLTKSVCEKCIRTYVHTTFSSLLQRQVNELAIFHSDWEAGFVICPGLKSLNTGEMFGGMPVGEMRKGCPHRFEHMVSAGQSNE